MQSIICDESEDKISAGKTSAEELLLVADLKRADKNA